MTIQFEQVQQWPTLPFKFFQHEQGSNIGVEPHWHTGIELNFLVNGGPLTFNTNGNSTVYSPGDCWAVNRRVVHSASGGESLPWDEFGFIIDETFLQDKLPSSQFWDLHLQGQESAKRQLNEYLGIYNNALAIRDLIISGLDEYKRLEILSHFYQLLTSLGKNFAHSLKNLSVTNNPQLVSTVMTRIHEEFGSALHSSQLATDAHVSLQTLNQQFQSNLGMSVHEYIRQIRLINAKKMLIETNKSVDYIASYCGFGSIKTFQRNFHEWAQKTPSEFRRSPVESDLNDANCIQ